ncbi:YidH family protein [Mycolicibacterium wolinskyi]|uniref:YidH family protein n=1 Tax=Mycolicibacterium wolinskyi TaxID=59750 RepID=UPI003917B0AD
MQQSGQTPEPDDEPDYRFTLANERTFLAWQRTSLGLLAAAVAVIQFVPDLGLPGARHILGLVLTMLATATAAVGLWRWRQVDRAMRAGTALPRHPTPGYLAVGLCVIGLLVLIAAVVRLVSG